MDETTIPLFPCALVDETLDFYRALGFEVTYEMRKPYMYAAMQRDAIELHFSGVNAPQPEANAGGCLVMIDDAALYHRTFSDALRAAFGKVPSRGIPRITRFREGQTRFTVVDPSGNSVLYIRRGEPDVEYHGGKEDVSGMERAIKNAATFRDFKHDDKGAAKILDVALRRFPDAVPIERARALAARAELAVAMDDAPRGREVAAELQRMRLSAADRKRLAAELRAADDLKEWLKEK